MAEFPTHPRLARLLVAAQADGHPGLGADLAALLDEREPAAGERPDHQSASDLLDRLQRWRRGRFDAAAKAARYWREKLSGNDLEPAADADAVGRLLAVAYPDRIGREREPGSGRYLFSGGFGARLSPRSAVRGGEWLVAVEVAGKPGGEGEIHRASLLSRETVEALFGGALAWQREIDWDEREGRVTAREVRRLGALPLQERPVKATAEDRVPALLAVIRRKGLELFDWSPAARQWRARVRLVAAHRTGWPDLSDAALLATLETWLAPYLTGVASLAALRRVDLLDALLGLLGWERQRELARLAPERLEVPSGSNIRLDYVAQDGPVLACKLQELFGLGETPRVAGGAVPVLIHLLSPAGRPLAVTRDLGSFWNRGYPEVKKEMKGRYPRHPWPDDPWNAPATRHAKRRVSPS
jgi:ATP-dependent helicase HrpB